MTILKNYRRYREIKLRNAYFLAGMNNVVIPVIKGAVMALLVVLAYGIVSRTVEASQSAADNRVAAKVAEQAAVIKAMSGLLEKCLSPGDHPITIGDELWFCGATNSGIKK